MRGHHLHAAFNDAARCALAGLSEPVASAFLQRFGYVVAQVRVLSYPDPGPGGEPGDPGEMEVLHAWTSDGEDVVEELTVEERSQVELD
jgi:hypothetical protein